MGVGGQGVYRPLSCIHSVCLPALHPGSCSCNHSPPSHAHPNPLFHFFMLQRSRQVYSSLRKPLTVRCCHLGTTRGWDLGVSAGGEFSDLHEGGLSCSQAPGLTTGKTQPLGNQCLLKASSSSSPRPFLSLLPCECSQNGEPWWATGTVRYLDHLEVTKGMRNA